MKIDPKNPAVISAREDLQSAALDLNLILRKLEVPSDPEVAVSISIERALRAHKELGDAIKKLVDNQLNQALLRDAEKIDVYEAGRAAGMRDRYLQYFPGHPRNEYNSDAWKTGGLTAPKNLGDLAKLSEHDILCCRGLGQAFVNAVNELLGQHALSLRK